VKYPWFRLGHLATILLVCGRGLGWVLSAPLTYAGEDVAARPGRQMHLLRVVYRILGSSNLLFTTPPTGVFIAAYSFFSRAGAGQLVGLPPALRGVG